MKIVARTAAVVFVLGLTGCILMWMTGRFDPFVTVDEKQVIDGSSVQAIEVEADSFDVSVIPGDGNDIEMHLYGEYIDRKFKDKFEITASASGNKLKIKAESTKKWAFLTMGRTSPEIIVKVPEKLYDEVRVLMTSGNVGIEDLQAGKLAVQSTSGNTKISGFSGNRLEFQGTSGNVSIQEAEGELAVTLTSGNVKISNSALSKNAAVKTTSGNINLYAEEFPSSLQLDLRTESGNVSAKVPKLVYQEKEENRIVGQVGQGGPLLKLQATSGNVKIAQQ